MTIKPHRTDILERVYMAVVKYWLENQLPPSLDDITKIMHYSAKSNTFNYLKELVELGYLEIDAGKRRCILVVGSTWTPPNIATSLELIKNRVVKKAVLL